MENTEKKVTEQNIVSDLEPKDDASSKSAQAIQVVDADPETDEATQTEDEQSVLEDEQFEEEESATIPEVVAEKSQLKKKPAAQIVTADKVQAEEVPTIPIGSIQTISTLEPEVSVHSVASMRAISMPAPLVVQPSEYRRGITEWLEIWRDGIRLNYLPLSLMPILLGTALAWTQSITPATPFGHLDIVHFVLALIAAAILQIGPTSSTIIMIISAVLTPAMPLAREDSFNRGSSNQHAY
ncbi:hypothetical protein [Dictyobacter kobayashii]|uniref:Uncharacterized protein n=1 Tax=Dictyobacter kobayashii TaxID=2014872 RepID=A0A402AIX4_9CHLR|nr:hypothetical protein [Dictyobacter kobayashii]GCE19013.1 hypothetical protein KDK_28130 [Dictyobacter kobayashii]